MVVNCSKCADTGKTGKDSYCTNCTQGEIQKRIDRGARKAERMKKTETAAKKEKAKQMELLEPVESTKNMEVTENVTIKFYLHERVKVDKDGYKPFIGDITDIDHRNKSYRVRAVHHVNGDRATGTVWAKAWELTEIKRELNRNDILGLIDQSLDTRDQKWFDELCERLATC